MNVAADNETTDSISRDVSSWFSLAWMLIYALGVLCIVSWFCTSNSHQFFAYFHVTCVLAFCAVVSVQCSVARPWYRFFVALPFLVGVGFLLASFEGNKIQIEVMLLPLAIALPILVVLEFIKFVFGRFQSIDNEIEIGHEGLQFGIFHLIALTTLIAVMLSIGQALAPLVSSSANSLSLIHI